MSLYITTRLIPIFILLLSFLGGCSLLPFMGDDDDAFEEDFNSSEQMMYRNAQRSMRSGNFEQAITHLERLEAQYPFGRYAEQAQLELVYARYQGYDHDSARAAADRFIRLHPAHSNVDYAYYLKGLASFNKNTGLMDRIFASDLSKRDMTGPREAYLDFAILLERFPNSAYAPDARQRMIYLRNLLADSELAIADYYLRRGAYIAAANRARYVVENYSQSMAVPEALLILVETNWKLGLSHAANDNLRVMAVNFPNHAAFDKEGNLVLAERIHNRDRSWANVLTFGLVDAPDVPPPIKIEHPEGFVPPATASEEAQEEPEQRSGWFSWLPWT
ncbi:MAG: outer membrane protein assembly factor BamD [Proteobacteria bacterium]|nr:outer membrane protein assembly factor BamD [Pseudomonadota bacterium]